MKLTMILKENLEKSTVKCWNKVDLEDGTGMQDDCFSDKLI